MLKKKKEEEEEEEEEKKKTTRRSLFRTCIWLQFFLFTVEGNIYIILL
jgi:hypothetical protein